MKKRIQLLYLTIFAMPMLFMAQLSMADNQTIIKQLNALGLQEIEIQNSPVANMKTVITEQGVLYVTDDGKHMMRGKLYALKNGDFADINNALLLDKLNAYQDEMIVYPAKNEKYSITVFSDITCQYCHLMHTQIQQYNDLGITVRYLAFPRAGLESKTAQQMEAIFTAKDRNFAYNQAEDGVLPTQLKKPDVVAKHFKLATQYGVRGTPSIVMPDGELIPGYIKPNELLAMLKQ